MLCTSLLLFNFQRSFFRPRFRGDLVIIPHPIPFVKPFFQSFLNSFENLFHRLVHCLRRGIPPRFCGELDYYTTFLPFCQLFFSFFSAFSSLLSTRTILMRHFVRHLGHKYNKLYNHFGDCNKTKPFFLANSIKKQGVAKISATPHCDKSQN